MPVAVTNPICTWCGKPDARCVCGQARPVAVAEKPRAKLALTTWLLGGLGEAVVYFGILVVLAPAIGAFAGWMQGYGKESAIGAGFFAPFYFGIGAGMIWSGGVIYLMVQLIKVGMWQKET